MKDYVAAFQDKIAELNEDAKVVHIVNAGNMNNGKSSLLNSLIGSELFPVEDIRTTTKNQTERWIDGVYLTDTPGLNTEKILDDDAAFKGYRHANMILFVHKMDVGELHKNEINAINKIKALFETEDFFWKHFCLVFTAFEQYAKNTSALDAIKDKSLSDIKKFCNGSEFPVFIVSNTRYQKGMAKNSDIAKKSGIFELRDYLLKNVPTWQSENQSIRNSRITREKNELVAQIERERQSVQTAIDKKTSALKSKQEWFIRELQNAVDQYSDDRYDYYDQRSILKDMKEKLENLRTSWENERAKYDD